MKNNYYNLEAIQKIYNEALHAKGVPDLIEFLNEEEVLKVFPNFKLENRKED